MAPKLSLTLGFYEHEENPSILAYAEDATQDDFEDWSGQGTSTESTSRWRNSFPDAATTTRWGSRLTSLSSGLLDAGTALTTRAKQLSVGESTQRAMDQLRKSILEVSTRTERSLRAVQHRLSEADIVEPEDQPESETACCDEYMCEGGCKSSDLKLEGSSRWSEAR